MIDQIDAQEEQDQLLKSNKGAPEVIVRPMTPLELAKHLKSEAERSYRDALIKLFFGLPIDTGYVLGSLTAFHHVLENVGRSALEGRLSTATIASYILSEVIEAYMITRFPVSFGNSAGDSLADFLEARRRRTLAGEIYDSTAAMDDQQNSTDQIQKYQKVDPYQPAVFTPIPASGVSNINQSDNSST